MIVREPTRDDLEIIQIMNDNQKDFRLHNIRNPIINRIVFENDIPVAYGIVKKLAEAIMLVNVDTPLSTRAKAMRELMKFAEFGAKASGCEQLHCFLSDIRLAEALMKHYGFVKTKDIVLIKNL